MNLMTAPDDPRAVALATVLPYDEIPYWDYAKAWKWAEQMRYDFVTAARTYIVIRDEHGHEQRHDVIHPRMQQEPVITYLRDFESWCRYEATKIPEGWVPVRLAPRRGPISTS